MNLIKTWERIWQSLLWHSMKKVGKKQGERFEPSPQSSLKMGGSHEQSMKPSKLDRKKGYMLLSAERCHKT